MKGWPNQQQVAGHLAVVSLCPKVKLLDVCVNRSASSTVNRSDSGRLDLVSLASGSHLFAVRLCLSSRLEGEKERRREQTE